MALTFPLADLFTRFPIKTNRFTLDRRQSFSRTNAGVVSVADFRAPTWAADFVSAAMSEDDCIELETMLRALKGMVNPFYGEDTRRPYPRRGPQSAAYGSAALASVVGAGRSEVTFSGLPSGLILSVGDKFSLAVDGIDRLFEVQEQVVASGAGVTTAVSVLPPIPAAVIAPANAQFSRPRVAMLADPSTVAFNPSGGLLGTVSFSAIEAI